MFRKFAISLLILSHGLLLYPDVFARERNIDLTKSSYIVRGSFVKAGLKDLKWLVNPSDWGFESFNYSAAPKKFEPEMPSISLEMPKPVPPKFAYSNIVLPIAEKHGIDWRLVAAVMAAESGFNPHAVSNRGAVGLMQVMPATAALYRIKMEDLRVPERNIEAGVRHLKMLHKRYAGDLQLVIAAYNAGEGNVDRFKGIPPYKDTRAFVKRVMGKYQRHMRNNPPETVPATGKLSIGAPGSGISGF